MKMRAAARQAAVILCAIVLVAVLAEARFPQPFAEYQARRAALRPKIDGPLVLFGFTSKQDPSEVAIFFQEPNFYYLTGNNTPDAAVMILPDGSIARTGQDRSQR